MFTLFDRYLLGRYLHACGIIFASILGLFIVIDAFANIDEFTKGNRQFFHVVLEMGKHYGYQSAVFLNTVGPMLPVMGTMYVLTMVLRCGEINPLLSAGIPTSRLAKPLVIGAALVNLLILLNQEFFIPSIVTQLQIKPGQDASTVDKIKPIQDFSSQIVFATGRIKPKLRLLIDCEIVLPVPELASNPTTILAKEAIYRPGDGVHPGRWQMKGVSPEYPDLPLSEAGRRLILAAPLEGVKDSESEEELIEIITEISFDQIVNRNKFPNYLSTRELMQRVQNPAFGVISIQRQCQMIHIRLTRPLLNILMVLLVIPVCVRKESRSLIADVALASLMSILILAAGQFFEYFAAVNYLSPDQAAWLPIALCGTCWVICLGWLRT